jgi:hypothetical protein
MYILSIFTSLLKYSRVRIKHLYFAHIFVMPQKCARNVIHYSIYMLNVKTLMVMVKFIHIYSFLTICLIFKVEMRTFFALI